MYKLMPNNILTGNPTEVVYRIHDKTWIPFDPKNPEYQNYLAWVAEGNTPQPADEPN
jgi:hypothetical protein